jgi:tripartite-type tricarboxylate transporter receptor subunit TctC
MHSLSRKTFVRATLVAACAALGAASAWAQEFPTKGKPIRIIVAFPPGAGPDAMARVALPKLAEELGVPVIIENKPGAGTVLAAQEVMRSAPDGHTIFYSASSTMAQAPHTLKSATYDPMTAFTPISMGARGPLVLIVSSELGVNNVQELVAWGKANPGKMSYGSFGVGTSSHIYGQVFAKSVGLTDAPHVPYKGGAEIATDLIGGRLPMAFDAAPAAIQTAKTGKAKIIGVASPQRVAALPGVPTLLEQGIKNIDLLGFVAWYGPAGMRPEVVNRLNVAIQSALAQADVKKLYGDAAYDASTSSPAELAVETRKAHEAWGNLVRLAGIEKQ